MHYDVTLIRLFLLSIFLLYGCQYNQKKEDEFILPKVQILSYKLQEREPSKKEIKDAFKAAVPSPSWMSLGLKCYTNLPDSTVINVRFEEIMPRPFPKKGRDTAIVHQGMFETMMQSHDLYSGLISFQIIEDLQTENILMMLNEKFNKIQLLQLHENYLKDNVIFEQFYEITFEEGINNIWNDSTSINVYKEGIAINLDKW